MDVYRDSDAWICKFDLAGVASDEVDVRVQGRTLTVAGERRDRFACEGRRAYSLEIAYYRFERTVHLPCELDAATIACDYRDGMLMVTITECEGQPRANGEGQPRANGEDQP